MSRLSSSFPPFLCVFVLVLALSVPAVAAGQGGECTSAEWIHVDSTVTRLMAGSGCFETHVPSAGILMLEAASLDSETQPRLDSFGSFAAGAKTGSDFTYLERRGRRMLLEIQSAGSFHFCVAAEAGEQASAGYRLRTGFVSFDSDKDGDPKEDEVEPDP